MIFVQDVETKPPMCFLKAGLSHNLTDRRLSAPNIVRCASRRFLESIQKCDLSIAEHNFIYNTQTQCQFGIFAEGDTSVKVIEPVSGAVLL